MLEKKLPTPRRSCCPLGIKEMIHVPPLLLGTPVMINVRVVPNKEKTTLNKQFIRNLIDKKQNVEQNHVSSTCFHLM